MQDKNTVAQLGAEAEAASKGIDALTASLGKLAGEPTEAKAIQSAAKEGRSGAMAAPGRTAGGADPAKEAEKKAAALEKTQAKIDDAAAKTAMQRLKQRQKRELKEVEGHEEEISALKKLHQKERLALIKESAEGTISTVASSLQTLAGHHKAFGGVAKAAMVADATMKAYNSAVGAYDQAMSLPRPFGLFVAPAAAVLAGAAGLANVAQIAGQKFEQGGPVIGPSHAMGGVLAELEGGEYVVPRRTVSRMGGFPGVEGTLQAAASRPAFSSTVNISVKGRSRSAETSASTIGQMAKLREWKRMERNARSYRIQA